MLVRGLHFRPILDLSLEEVLPMTTTQSWKTFFTDWPAAFPRGGVLVSTLNEMIPFRRFWLKDDFVLLERNAPDATGGRYVLMGFDVINSVKFVNPLKDEMIAQAGFDAARAESRLQPA